MRTVRKAVVCSGALVGLVGAASIALSPAGAQDGVASVDFAEQVEAGRGAYAQHCAVCHGDGLSGGQFAPALTGAAFLDAWGSAPREQLLDYMRSSMPPASAG